VEFFSNKYTIMLWSAGMGVMAKKGGRNQGPVPTTDVAQSLGPHNHRSGLAWLGMVVGLVGGVLGLVGALPWLPFYIVTILYRTLFTLF
jgi:hypothetical protein